MDDDTLDGLNKQIEVELQEQGIAVPSTTTISGKCVLHLVITNHRSRREDFDVLIQEVIRLGRKLSQKK
jgi:glutamate/tyrosine decarboxylase-like PLP-dependent enzyme